MGAAAERRDDVRSTGRGPLNWRRGGADGLGAG